jgi:hypothetical protein
MLQQELLQVVPLLEACRHTEASSRQGSVMRQGLKEGGKGDSWRLIWLRDTV